MRRASLLVNLASDKMALMVEVVVDLGADLAGQCHVGTQLAGRLECGIAEEHEKNKLRWISVPA
jgi:hypothetical protein